tara:strand:+ start:276 stop:617 length:342 start_codon:yes stop_codon:yes gene_type:complete
MTSRYDNRDFIINDSEIYKDSPIFKNRRIKYIRQYGTPSFKYPTEDEIESFTVVNHVWKVGDRFYKLANSYYGNPKFWWIIAWFNQISLEGDLELGDVVHIPLPLEEALTYFE